LAVAYAAAIAPCPLTAETVPVRFPEGLVHGFLTLRSLGGAVLAEGDLIQFLRDGRVTSRLILKFRDGSLSDETAVFTQDKEFRLVSDHLIQKGPSFKRPMEVTIEAASGKVTVTSFDGGKSETQSEQMDLPADLANGMVLTLIKNLDPRVPLTT